MIRIGKVGVGFMDMKQTSRPKNGKIGATSKGGKSARTNATTDKGVVGEKDRASAEERLNSYVREARGGHLALRDRVIRVLRRHQEHQRAGEDSELPMTLEEIAKQLKPLPAEVLRDVFTAEGKPAAPAERALMQYAKNLVQRAIATLKEDKLVIETKEGFTLPEIKLTKLNLPFTISPELKSWLPPPIEEELSGLEGSLLVDGPEDSLHVWKEKNVLIDGHSRVNILIRHGRLAELKKLARGAVEHSFADLDAVRAWMEERQRARRNQSRMASLYFLGLRYNREKHQGARTDLETSAENQRRSTDERLAEEHGCTASTVRRAGALATNIGKLVDVADELEKGGAILRGLLLRQRSKGSPRVTERTIRAIAEEKNRQRQEKLVRKLLQGASVGKTSKTTGQLVVRLPRNDADAQTKVLSQLGRDGLKKLRAAIDTFLANPEWEEPSDGEEP